MKLAPVTRIGLLLSEIFRTDTTPLHLTKLGFKNISKLMKHDPVNALLRSKTAINQFQELATILSRGIEAELS